MQIIIDGAVIFSGIAILIILLTVYLRTVDNVLTKTRYTNPIVVNINADINWLSQKGVKRQIEITLYWPHRIYFTDMKVTAGQFDAIGCILGIVVDDP